MAKFSRCLLSLAQRAEQQDVKQAKGEYEAMWEEYEQTMKDLERCVSETEGTARSQFCFVFGESWCSLQIDLRVKQAEQLSSGGRPSKKTKPFLAKPPHQVTV